MGWPDEPPPILYCQFKKCDSGFTTQYDLDKHIIYEHTKFPVDQVQMFKKQTSTVYLSSSAASSIAIALPPRSRRNTDNQDDDDSDRGYSPGSFFDHPRGDEEGEKPEDENIGNAEERREEEQEEVKVDNVVIADKKRPKLHEPRVFDEAGRRVSGDFFQRNPRKSLRETTPRSYRLVQKRKPYTRRKKLQAPTNLQSAPSGSANDDAEIQLESDDPNSEFSDSD